MQIAGEIPGVDGGLDDFIAELDAEAGGSDARAEFVVVGEIFGEGNEAADGIECGAGDGEGGTEAEVEAAVEESRGEDAGGEVGGDAESFHLRAEGLVGDAAVEGGDEAGGGLGWSGLSFEAKGARMWAR